MEENTSHPHHHTPSETPASEAKKESGMTFSQHIQNGWRKTHNKLGTGGVIAVILALIILMMLCSDDRHDMRRFDRGYYGQPAYNIRYNDDRGRDQDWMQSIQDEQDALRERMDAMEDMRNDMMRSQKRVMEAMPSKQIIIQDDIAPVGGAQYSGYRVKNDQDIRYSIQAKDKTLSGTLTGSNEEVLKRYADELTKLDMTVTAKNGQIQFTGTIDRLDDVIEVVNTDME